MEKWIIKANMIKDKIFRSDAMKKFRLVWDIIICLLVLLTLSFTFVYGIIFGVIAGLTPGYYGSMALYATVSTISLWLLLLLVVFLIVRFNHYVWRNK